MKAYWDRLVVSRFGPHIVAAVAALGVVAPLGIYLAHLSADYADERIAQATVQVTTHTRLLQELVERAATAARLIARPSVEAEMSRHAVSDLFVLAGPVEALEITAADGAWVRLERGVAQAGEHVRALPPLQPAGAPALTMQGDLVVVVQALNEPDVAGAAPWGHARAYLRIEQIIAAARLEDLPSEGFGVRLRYTGDSEPAGRLLHTGGTWNGAASVSRPVAESGAGHLSLEVSPSATRFAGIPVASVLVLLVTAALCHALVVRLLRKPAELQHEVIRQTRLLTRDKRALEQEVAQRTELDRQLSEHLAFLEQLLLAIPGPVFTTDTAGRYVEFNRAFEDFFGQSREMLLGKTVFDLEPPVLAVAHHRHDVELLARGGSTVYESLVPRADGERREVIFHKAALHSARDGVTGIVGIVIDITERNAAERRLARLNRMLAVLSETNQAIARTHDADALLERIGEALRERGGFPRAWLYLMTPDGPRVIAGSDTDLIVRRVTMAISRADNCCPLATSRFCKVAECCEPELVLELTGLDVTTLAHLPLWSEGECVGGIQVLGSGTDLFGAEERKMLEELAANASFALDALAHERRRRKAEGKLQLAAQVFENSAEGILVTDAENRIVMVNKAFTQVTGYALDEVIGRNPRLLSSGRQGADFYHAMWHSLQSRGEWHGEIENRRKNGEFYPEWLTISEVRSESGELTHHVAVFSDLTARKQIEERLNFLAHYDALTGLPNRILFTDRLQHALVQARSDGQRVAVAFLDLDRFQVINETIGHAMGDRLLQEISGRLATGLHEGDSLSRLGGDEFALIFTNLACVEEVGTRVARIQTLLRQPVHTQEHELHCSASIGVAVFPDDGENVDVLVKNAESAMYSAMEGGGNSFRFFRQDVHQRTAERLRLEGKLHFALERGELMVYFQPLVSATSGRIVGAEALLRWQRADLGGFVSPSDFVPLLEATGLIAPVGEWVLRTACEERQRWRELTGEELFVAVNLSAVQLADTELAAKVEQILHELDFNPRFLEIELTESSVMRDAEAGIRTLRQLKSLGVRLSLDDFGTGYSSLSHLKRLPLDTLKVDRSFVQDIPDDAEATFLTRAIVAMGHSLRLEIVAEGVETVAQVTLLRELDCDVLQGFYFSPAVPAEQFLELLRTVSPYRLPDSDDGDAGTIGTACASTHAI